MWVLCYLWGRITQFGAFLCLLWGKPCIFWPFYDVMWYFPILIYLHIKILEQISSQPIYLIQPFGLINPCSSLRVSRFIVYAVPISIIVMPIVIWIGMFHSTYRPFNPIASYIPSIQLPHRSFTIGNSSISLPHVSMLILPALGPVPSRSLPHLSQIIFCIIYRPFLYNYSSTYHAPDFPCSRRIF